MYLLLSCCPAEGRISGIVDAPNACATLAIPLAIFDQVRQLRCYGVTFAQPLMRVPGRPAACLTLSVAYCI